MVTHAYRHVRLMEESEARVEMAAIYDSPADNLVASRLLGHPRAYRRWEGEHDRLMRVSAQSHIDRQIVALRSTALSLVHRRAIFDLGEHLMEDSALEEPLQIYEQWYAEYFRAFCDGALAETEEEKLKVAPMEALKPLLKYQLNEAREVRAVAGQAQGAGRYKTSAM